MMKSFDWTSSITCKYTQEKLPIDSLNRSNNALFLSEFLSHYADDSYVLNIDSEWGSGKSYFLKRWAKSLSHNHPVVFFDAWANDFHNEPLPLLLGGILESLENSTATKITKLTNNVAKKATSVMTVMAPALAKGLTKKLIQIDLDEVSEQLEQKENEIISSDIVSNATAAILALPKKQQNAIAELKLAIEENLTKIFSSSSKKSLTSPMFVFIDELDRCRPTFAIELLEVVKHIFTMRSVVFVIASDTEQLQHSIRAVYGIGFNSSKYLERFFDRRFTLSKPELDLFVASQSSLHTIKERAIISNEHLILNWTAGNTVSFIASLFEGFNVDLRSAGQIMDRVTSILLTDNGRLSPVWLIIMETIRVFNPEGYRKLFKGEIGSDDRELNKLFAEVLKIKTHKKQIYKSLKLPIHHDSWGNSPLFHVEVNPGKPQVIKKRELIDSPFDLQTLLKTINKMAVSGKQSAKVIEHASPVHLMELYLWKVNRSLDFEMYKSTIEVASRLE